VDDGREVSSTDYEAAMKFIVHSDNLTGISHRTFQERVGQANQMLQTSTHQEVLFTLAKDGHVRGDYDSLMPFLARFLARRHLHMAHRAAMIQPHLITLTSSDGESPLSPNGFKLWLYFLRGLRRGFRLIATRNLHRQLISRGLAPEDLEATEAETVNHDRQLGAGVRSTPPATD
jgi:hypothetical protein